jgi:hypothetical protein
MTNRISEDVVYVDFLVSLKILKAICQQSGFGPILEEVIHHIETFKVTFSNRTRTCGEWQQDLYMSRLQFRYVETYLEGIIELTCGLKLPYSALCVVQSHALPVTKDGVYDKRCKEIAKVIQDIKAED